MDGFYCNVATHVEVTTQSPSSYFAMFAPRNKLDKTHRQISTMPAIHIHHPQNFLHSFRSLVNTICWPKSFSKRMYAIDLPQPTIYVRVVFTLISTFTNCKFGSKGCTPQGSLLILRSTSRKQLARTYTMGRMLDIYLAHFLVRKATRLIIGDLVVPYEKKSTFSA